jgi:type II secretory pathway component GspD/PulD (secretin)
MVPRTLLPALAAVAALGTAPAQTPCETPAGAEPTAAVHRLRNVAATDAAHALNAFALEQNLTVIAAPEPVSNTVLLSGRASDRNRAAALLATLDQEPPTAVAQMAVMRVPAGFAEDAGLGEGNETKWVLTPREARMLAAAVRREKERGQLEVLSRPTLTVADNQTGFVQTGDGTTGLTARLTPRVAADGGSVAVRVETQVAAANPTPVLLGDGVRVRAFDAQTIQAVESVPNGGTLVVRGPRSKTADGGATEVLLVLTIDRVKAQPVR